MLIHDMIEINRGHCPDKYGFVLKPEDNSVIILIR